MKLTLTQKLPTLQAKKLLKKQSPKDSHCLVVLVDDTLNLIANDTLKPHKDRINQLIKIAHFKGTVAETLADYALTEGKNNPIQLLIVGIGKANNLTAIHLQKIGKAIYQSMSKRVEGITVALGNALTNDQFAQFANGLLNASYRFNKYKSESPTPVLQKISVLASKDYQATLDFANAVYAGQTMTRNVANEPGNVCYPEYMADQAERLAATYPNLLKVTVVNQKQMEKLGMNCFLSVSKGSDREGKLVILEYHGKSKFTAQDGKKGKKHKAENAPIALVGKGVTFDTGGISLKPGAGMGDMKFDMGGSASVLGTIKALCEAKLPINVVAALALAENMPSARATRPGDIVKSMSGKTVEILNTDAEGRLVLCDTLTYIQRYQPKTIVDAATLTGACVIALGNVRSAVFSNDEDLLFALQNASEQTGDAIWHMPLDDEYQTQLDSPIADMQNIGGREAGSVTAACFLSRFIEEGQPWAHLDIAGTAWISGKQKEATGRPVPLFMQYLKNASKA